MYSQVYARPIIITGLDYGTDYTGNNCAGVMKNSQSLPVLFLPSHMAKVAEVDETLLAFTLIEVCIKECAPYKFTSKFLRSQPTYADILTYVWNT